MDVAAGQQFGGFVVVVDFVALEQKIVGFDAGRTFQMPPGAVVDLIYGLNILLAGTGSVLAGDLEMLVRICTGLNGLVGCR
jgi:hypothetical protein